jgi:potassium channel subfamily K
MNAPRTGISDLTYFQLIGDLAGMHIYAPPVAPSELYSGGFWYGIAAAVMYLLLSMMLMGNMVGYIRGHYPQHFQMTDDQRILIVQTMLFFMWLAGGAGAYSRLEGWHYIDAVSGLVYFYRFPPQLTAFQLYYCDVTILTVGFGDLFPTETAGRALLIPYSITGMIMLGLMISAIYKSVQEIGEQNIVRHHFEQQRAHAKKSTVRSSLELQRREIEEQLAAERAMAKQAARGSARSPHTSGSQYQYSINARQNSISDPSTPTLTRTNTMQTTLNKKHKRIVLLKEEKERFEAMRNIQKKAETWRHWYRLTVTLSVFAIFWLVGAVFFWQAEMHTLGMSYWQSIYFCWVSLLSIGYGDFSPHSGAGRCFFVIWSMIAVPTMTILAGDLTNTVVSVFNAWSITVADFTVLPQYGLWRNLMNQYPWLFLHLPGFIGNAIQRRADKGDAEKKESEERDDSYAERSSSAEDGVTTKDEQYADGKLKVDFEGIVDQQDADKIKQPDATALVRQLALAIRRTAHDMTVDTPREYSYEEWVEFTRLIRFSAVGGSLDALLDEEEGMVEWDWIGEDSPMMSQQTESQFVHDRLCESLVRYLKRNPPVTPFSEILKERGEEALRLKGGTAPEEDDVLYGSGSNSMFSGSASMRSRKSSFAQPTPLDPDDLKITNLHPVEEESHDHHDL